MVVDVVDTRNRVIAQAERQSLFEQHLNFRTVNVLVFDRQRRLILQHLVSDHLRSPNRLGASAAGYLYAGESYFEAANRKLREELGLSTQVRGVGQVEMLDAGSRKFVGIFTAAADGPPAVADDQIAELLYMTTSEIESLMTSHRSLFTPTFVVIYEYFQRWAATR